MKQIKRLFIVLIFIVSLIINVVSVKAANGDITGGIGNPAQGNGAGGGGGSDGISLKVFANGYRVTVVKSDGSRAPATQWNGPTKSIDYWTYKVKYAFSYEYPEGSNKWYTKPVGYEGIINGPSMGVWTNNVFLCKKLSSKNEDCIMDKIPNNDPNGIYKEYLTNTRKEFFLPSISTYKGTQWDGGPENDKNDIVFTVNNGLIKHVYDEMYKEIHSETEKENGYENFVQLLKNAGIGKDGETNSQILSQVSEYYLLIEPIEAIAFHNDANGYIGTFKELYSSTYGGKKLSVSKIFESDYRYNYRSYINPFSYYNAENPLAGINACKISPYSSNPINWYNRSNLEKHGCLGVFIVNLSEISGPQPEQCKDTARNRLDASKNIDDKTKYYKSITLYNEETKKYDIEENPIYNEYKTKCFPNGVTGNVSDKYGLDMDNCYQLSYEYLKKVGGNIPEKDEDGNIVDLCMKPSCGFALYTIDSNELHYNKNIRTESSNDTEYDSAIAYIYNEIALNNKFSDSPTVNDFLQYNIYNSLHVPAACGKKTLDCPLSEHNPFSCTDACKFDKDKNKWVCNEKRKSFTIADSLDDKCIQAGYAYSGESSLMGLVAQSSVDLNYENSEVYCTESITFDLPTKPEVTHAGTLLGWGISDNVTKDGIFGKITVTRDCRFNNFNKNEKIDNINIKWYKEIEKDTDIELTYKDRHTEEEIIKTLTGNKLDIRFSDFIVDVGDSDGLPTDFFAKIYGEAYSSVNRYEEDGETKFVDSSTNHNKYAKDLDEALSNYKCNDDTNKCKGLKRLKTTATYDIYYPSSLTWYSDKINPFDPKSADKVIDKEDPYNVAGNYVYLGAGMITTFADPTCEYGGTSEKYESEEEIKSDEKNAGELSISIKNIGTRVYPNDDNIHHFDNVLYLNITDTNGIADDSIKNGAPIDGRNNKGIYYSCPFEIENKLFGTEYGSNKNCNPYEEEAPKGLDVVFRTITLMEDSSPDSLFKAFPGRTGESRLMGYNWLKIGDGNKFNIGAFYGILRNDIYNEKEPMYHIELTPGTIRDIREDNKTKRDEGINPYTKMDTDTYLFNSYSLLNVFLEKYDMDKDGEIKPNDSMIIEICNLHPDNTTWTKECKNNTLTLNDANDALYYYSDKARELIKSSEEDTMSYHVSSLYLDTLRENYGLTGVCINDDAETRLKKYKDNGCFYSDKGEVVINKDVGSRVQSMIDEYGHKIEAGESATLKEIFESVIASNYTTEVKYKTVDYDNPSTVYTYTDDEGETHVISSDVPDIYITEGYDFSE